jgi:multiple sugar transport system permease protein
MPANFVGLQNYRELLNDPFIWSNFSITAKYVIVSVVGQVVVGFGTAMLLNRDIPFKGLITTLLLLPMMLSMAVVGLFWKLLYDPSFGIINYVLGLGTFEWLPTPDGALRGRADRHLDVVALRHAAVAGGSLRRAEASL